MENEDNCCFDYPPTNEDLMKMDYDKLFDYLFKSAYTKIDEIKKMHPEIIKTMEKDSRTMILIKQNIPEKIAYSYELALLSMIIIMSYKHICQKEKEEKKEENCDDNDDMPEVD